MASDEVGCSVADAMMSHVDADGGAVCTVLVLAPYLSRDQAGAAHATISIINALARRGHVTRVIAFDVESGILDSRVHITLIDPPPARRFAWRFDRLLRVRDFARSLRRGQLDPADFVYTQSMEFGLAFRELDRSTHVVSHLGHILAEREAREEIDLKEPWLSLDAGAAGWLERRTYAQRGFTHVVSTAIVGETRARRFHLPHDLFRVQPLGIDASRFVRTGSRDQARSELGIANDEVVLISVARFVAWKNHGWLVRALEHLPSNFTLLFVGDGPEREHVEQSVPLRLRERVKFVGHQEPRPFLEAADIFALPSAIESFGVAYAEAMFMGLPCIGLRNNPPEVLSSAQEVIEDGVSGFVVGSAQQLCDRLQMLGTESLLRQRMSAAALTRARSMFDVERYAEFLERIAQGGSGQALDARSNTI